jgi:anti-sigma-K factor RskA
VGWWTWHVQREAALVYQRWQDVQRHLVLQRQAFTLITAPEARPVVLRSDKSDSQARGILLLKPEEPHAMLIVQDLPPLQRDRAYQLWLGWGDRQRDDGGVFRVDEQGFGLMRITAPRPFTAYQRVGITEEPAGGSPGPTSPRVIGATLQSH